MGQTSTKGLPHFLHRFFVGTLLTPVARPPLGSVRAVSTFAGAPIALPGSALYNALEPLGVYTSYDGYCPEVLELPYSVPLRRFIGRDPTLPPSRQMSMGLPPGYSSAPNMTDGECAMFRAYVERECAIAIGQDKKYLMEARLGRLLAETESASFTEFYRKVVYGADENLRRRIIEAITTNETLWFRDSHPFAALRDEVFTELAGRSGRSKRPIRIWCAGCSTGQEPYSVAMLIDDFCHGRRDLNLSWRDFELVGTDISSAALRIARMGRYDRISMDRGFGAEWEPFRRRYFETRGAVSELSPEIRSRVNLASLNLQDNFGHLGRFDLILLRYVLIYFSSEFKERLLSRIANSLMPGGLVLLGAAETLGEGCDRFRTERIGRSYFNRVIENPIER